MSIPQTRPCAPAPCPPGPSPGFTLRTYVHLMPSADDRMRQAVDAVFASSDGPATAQGMAR